MVEYCGDKVQWWIEFVFCCKRATAGSTHVCIIEVLWLSTGICLVYMGCSKVGKVCSEGLRFM
jgi:hypothetical protein